MDANQQDSYLTSTSDHIHTINKRVAGGKFISYNIYISIGILTSYGMQAWNTDS